MIGDITRVELPSRPYHRWHKLGMWLFLGSEILFFGGLFAAYAI